ncbi:MAG TPA: response regulator transcription factor [Solirubrobacterales bacterium]|nr:response regulator transcription factor [Solirubrobacterales bacterium]
MLLVDEDAILRSAVRGLLEGDGLRVIGEANTAEEGLTLAKELEPDVITMAVAVRGGSGIEATRSILEAVPATRVVILTNSADAGDAAAAIGAGACGYLLKDDPPEEIVAGIRIAAGGASPISPRVATELLGILRFELGSSNGYELTPRERDVLMLLAEGHSNAEIAERLSISVATVKRHLSHLLVKLRVSNRTQAAVEAVRRGLL